MGWSKLCAEAVLVIVQVQQEELQVQRVIDFGQPARQRLKRCARVASWMASLSSGRGSFWGTTRSSGQSWVARMTCFQLGVGFDCCDFTRGRICGVGREWKAERAQFGEVGYPAPYNQLSGKTKESRMNLRPSGSWNEFLNELRMSILPLYGNHERTFDFGSIHGRMHVCRCLLFSEFMCRHYVENTRFTPRVTWIRYAVAFHDSGRQGNGPDVWEADSSRRCIDYLLSKDFPKEDAEAIGGLITKDGGSWGLEKRIVHDADVLDIMRLCCGHGGRIEFREHALRFLGPRDDPIVRDPVRKIALIEEAWALIEATEEIKPTLQASIDYMGDVLRILSESRDRCPLLAKCLTG